MSHTPTARKPYRKAPPQHREIRHDPPVFRDELEGTAVPSEQSQEPLSDGDLIKQLQQQNEELRRHLNHTTHKLEMMESDFESSRHYLETELNHAREEMDKLRDKFRRLQNSYTASQRTNQDLEDKLHALIKKAEMDKKTLDWEIVELTNKLLDAKTTIDRLEELNERYRQDCNLAVQLLKCNKSHFRNHKFSDLPYVLQEMVNKHMESSTELQSEKESSPLLVPSDVVPTSVIARVLEKPEPLILNSAQSSSGNQPMAEDVFVHVDMSGNTNGGRGSGKEGEQETGKPPNGVCKRQNSTDGAPDETATFERLNPYPTPPQNLFPGRKAVIEFSSDDKVKIPKNSPLPNCTYATRQAISLSLVQGEEDGFERHRTVPNSPSSDGRRSAQVSSKHLPQSPKPGTPKCSGNELRSTQSSPFSSPPQVPSAFASSTSSEEDLMANWQRMFVEKVAPTSERVIAHRTSFSSETARQLQNSLDSRMDGGSERQLLYSDGEESGHSYSWTASRDSSLDTDSTESKVRRGRLMTDYGAEFSLEEGEQLLLHTASGNQPVSQPSSSSPQKHKEYVEVGSGGSSAEERHVQLQESHSTEPEELVEIEDKPSAILVGRQQKSPKRMGVHHLLRKDSLTRAQEQGTLLD
ncbi:tight junction-associated protein 1 isoform X2 [Callorhinchus milii]|uniref:tight junction-associated protein 1 isoform X2 n=1 Tax=Callorhinchus milii TaxID=7868 RepID=UPI0004575D69|nr:tight junction-associated protein 1 isoform X2 [Callorhinchus milii]XP_007896429.1 tight junction-associated protein 1 isoform X2 [Callorhinchus milii]XP_042189170.1 tight junction-associated protein 1 isoform X2 [Callorhinchus milii]|eukprot:gi/632960841/ref/XP_007896428.1/ PREDICTED: tight junction-associated protein 1 isoform X1 [Callorhinchus milii]